MKHFVSFFSVFLFFTSVSRGEVLSVGKNYGQVVNECGVKRSKQHIWIFKQWHLAPQINTQKNPAHPLPQETNQTAIYKQLADWIGQKKIKTIFSEGVSSEITDSFTKVFNGWDLKDLRGLENDKSFDKIVTLIPLKLKAKFRDAVKVYGGDNDELIKRENLALSDARGTVGFLSQIITNQKDLARVQPYLKRVIALDHLSSDTTPEKAIKILRSDLQDDIKKVLDGIEARNLKFIEVIKAHPSSEGALVIGGLHASGLVELLKKNDIDCTVVQPEGYDEKDEKIIETLKTM